MRAGGWHDSFASLALNPTLPRKRERGQGGYSMNLQSGPQIETRRLLLRLPHRDDFDAYAEMLGDEETARYIGGHMTRSAAWRKFLQMPGAWSMQGFAMFSIVEKSSGEWIGQAGPWMPEGWPGTEVGWSLRRQFTGRGYALGAATAAIDWAFDTLGWTEVIHSIQPPNTASIA